jgi:hypothetical protein
MGVKKIFEQIVGVLSDTSVKGLSDGLVSYLVENA